MKPKKLAILTVAVFATFFVTDFVIHQFLMKSMYEATPHLWRPESDMQGYLPLMFLGQLTLALFFSWIFVHGYRGKGVAEGVRFGLLAGGLSASKDLILYTVVPYGADMILGWIVLGTLQSVIAGVVCALVSDKVK